MKMIWKLLGAAALAVGLTPYKVEKDEETGETKYQALLWQATKTPQEGEKGALDVNIGFKLPSKEEEVHLFSDELCVEYTGAPVTTENVGEAAEEIAKEVDEAVEEVAAEVAEAVEEVVQAADEAAEEVVTEVAEAVEEADEAAEPKAE